VFDFSNDIFSSAVAVSGDAHQTQVAKDVFRQEVRFERSVAIREDIRDAKQLMIDAIQDDLMIGSIICGICFGMLIEGTPPEGTSRTIFGLWLLTTVWSATFSLLGVWMALAFQTEVLAISGELLLNQHRFSLPDDAVVGTFGGRTVATQVVAGWHQEGLQQAGRHQLEVARQAAETVKAWLPTFFPKDPASRSKSMSVDSGSAAPGKIKLEKGAQLWQNRARLLDVPVFLLEQWLLPRPLKGEIKAGHQITFWVRGKKTLYVAGRPCRLADSKDIAQIEPPVVSMKSSAAQEHSEETGKTLTRVQGFSIFVQLQEARQASPKIVELPIYKCILDEGEDGAEVEVTMRWSGHNDYEAVLLMVREGHIVGLEENWPKVDFQEKARDVLPMQEYAADCLENSVKLLGAAAAVMSSSRFRDLGNHWWFEVVLVVLAFATALGATVLLPLRLKRSAVEAPDSDDEEEPPHDDGPQRRTSRLSNLRAGAVVVRRQGSQETSGKYSSSASPSLTHSKGGSAGTQTAEGVDESGMFVDAEHTNANRKKIMRRLSPLLHQWSWVVNIVCLASLAAVPVVNITWIDDAGFEQLEQPEAAVISWTTWDQLRWPTFLRPTQVVVDPASISSSVSMLSGALIWTSNQASGESESILLPLISNGIGLGFAHGRLYFVDDLLLWEVATSAMHSGEDREQLVLPGAGNVSRAKLRAVARLPLDLDQARLAAVTALGSSVAVVVASAHQEHHQARPALSLCWHSSDSPSSITTADVFTSDASNIDSSINGTLPQLTALPLGGVEDALDSVTAMHVCAAPLCAEDSVLWVAGTKSEPQAELQQQFLSGRGASRRVLLAVSLSSGQVLGAFTPPAVEVSSVASSGSSSGSSASSLRGVAGVQSVSSASGAQETADHAATVATVSLTGNATHLFALLVDSSGQVVLSTPYPELSRTS